MVERSLDLPKKLKKKIIKNMLNKYSKDLKSVNKKKLLFRAFLYGNSNFFF